MILLDTHVFLWFCSAPERLQARARETIELEFEQAAEDEPPIVLSAATFWEVAFLVRKRKLEFAVDPQVLLRQVGLWPGFRIEPITAEIALHSQTLADDFHSDPADRFLVATAQALDCPLMTRDSAILRYARNHSLEVVEA